MAPHLPVPVGSIQRASPWTDPLKHGAGHQADVEVVRWHPTCQYLATGSSDRTVRLWDATSGACVRIFVGHRAPVRSPTGPLAMAVLMHLLHHSLDRASKACRQQASGVGTIGHNGSAGTCIVACTLRAAT